MYGYVVATVTMALLGVGIYLPFCIFVLRPARRVNQKYPLFAVRDEFIRLHIQGAFEKDPAASTTWTSVTPSLDIRKN